MYILNLIKKNYLLIGVFGIVVFFGCTLDSDPLDIKDPSMQFTRNDSLIWFGGNTIERIVYRESGVIERFIYDFGDSTILGVEQMYNQESRIYYPSDHHFFGRFMMDYYCSGCHYNGQMVDWKFHNQDLPNESLVLNKCYLKNRITNFSDNETKSLIYFIKDNTAR